MRLKQLLAKSAGKPARQHNKHNSYTYVSAFVLVTASFLFAAAQHASLAKADEGGAGSSFVTPQKVEAQAMTEDNLATDSQTSDGSSGSTQDSSSGANHSLNVTSSSDASGSTSTSVEINGQAVPVPKSGELHKTIVGSDGSVSSVNISVSGNGQTTQSNSSSVNVQLNSSSSDSTM